METKSRQLILNAGIVVEQANLGAIFGKSFRRNNSYNTYERENVYN